MQWSDKKKVAPLEVERGVEIGLAGNWPRSRTLPI